MPGACNPRFDVSMLKQKCLGGPNCHINCCDIGYKGQFCSECARNYYRQRSRCVPCTDGETVKMYIFIGTFIVLFNFCLFFLHYDIMNTLFGVISARQMFRAIGLLGGSALPDGILNFYGSLGLIAMDYEFGQPGCEGTRSDFVGIYQVNLAMLVLAASPVVLFMPALSIFGWFIHLMSDAKVNLQ